MLDQWPPLHTVRRSRRARGASLKITSSKGLEVILPMRYKLSTVNQILAEKRSWIEKHAHLITPRQAVVLELPNEIYFACNHAVWRIHYLFSPVKGRLLITGLQELTLLGDTQNRSLCFQILNFWVRKQAEQILAPILHALSREVGLPFNSLTIRNQKTRWGSCSSDKNISLNFRLIFLPPNLVRHILLHELCHTVHLNHSIKFWKLLAKFDTDWHMHHHLSKKVEKKLPKWIDFSV